MYRPILHSSPPILAAKTIAPVARLWQKTQDGVAKLIGLKDANTASAIIGVTGLTTMVVVSVLGPIGPAVYGAGLFVAGVGGAGLVENHITQRLVHMDGKGKV